LGWFGSISVGKATNKEQELELDAAMINNTWSVRPMPYVLLLTLQIWRTGGHPSPLVFHSLKPDTAGCPPSRCTTSSDPCLFNHEPRFLPRRPSHWKPSWQPNVVRPAMTGVGAADIPLWLMGQFAGSSYLLSSYFPPLGKISSHFPYLILSSFQTSPIVNSTGSKRAGLNPCA
jgi:hypothetical protein